MAAAAASLAAAASATPSQIIWDSSNNGPIAFAEASWETRTAASVTDAGVLAAQTHRDGPGTTGPEHGAATHVFFEVRTMYLDSQGQPTGGVAVSGNANGSMPFRIDDRTLTAAAVENAVVPVTSCTLDAAGSTTSCVDGGTANVSVDWTGQGGIARGSDLDHFLAPGGWVFLDRLSGTFRQASATATIGGQSFDAAGQQLADMGNNVQLTVLICPHGC